MSHLGLIRATTGHRHYREMLATDGVRRAAKGEPESMGEQPSRTLLWSSRIVPIEIRGLLRGIVALFGITAIAMLAVSGPTLQTVLAATGTSALNIVRSEEHTSELQSRGQLVSRLLL